MTAAPCVAPFKGAWIEIARAVQGNKAAIESLPSRERGLKSSLPDGDYRTAVVASFKGAWIEMTGWKLNHTQESVAPFKGAWIEIPGFRRIEGIPKVASFKGAWIEIGQRTRTEPRFSGRFLQGSVD